MNKNNAQILFTFTLLLAAFALAACDAAAPAAQATATPKATQPPKPTGTETPKVVPITDTPTRTSVLSPTVEPTPTFPPTAAAEIATLDAIVAEKPELKNHYSRYCVTIANCANASNLGLSPNGKWAAFFSTKQGTGGLTIVNIVTKKQWEIFYADFEDVTGCDCVMDVEYWSQGGRYLFIMPRMVADGGLGWFWQKNTHLIRMELENGTWVDTGMGAAYSFSPGDRYIAFRRGNELVIHEFFTGEERVFVVPEEYTAFGQLMWSPDANQIMFVASTVEELLEYKGVPDGLSLLLLDVTSMQVRIILEKDERFLFPLEWQDADTVFLGSLLEIGPSGYAECCHTLYKLELANETSVYKSP